MARTTELENGPICLARRPDGRTCGHEATWFLADLGCWVCREHVPPLPAPYLLPQPSGYGAFAAPPEHNVTGIAEVVPRYNSLGR